MMNLKVENTCMVEGRRKKLNQNENPEYRISNDIQTSKVITLSACKCIVMWTRGEYNEAIVRTQRNTTWPPNIKRQIQFFEFCN